MRPIKRLLVFLSEVAVLLFGCVLSGAVGGYLASIGSNLDGFAFLAGLLLTVAGFFLLRRKTRPWKIKYDAAGWTLSQAERKLHPTRAQYKRVIRRVLLWVPSVVAAFVLCFFPVATHVANPGSHYLKHYRVPIPWTVTVFPMSSPPAEYNSVIALLSSSARGRIGVTPFWDNEHLFLVMTFGRIQPDADTFEFNHKITERRRQGATEVSSREFQLDNIAITCWQYLPYRRDFVGLLGLKFTSGLWEIACETPVDVHEQNFYASFQGREEDMGAFYKIIEGVTPVE